MDSALAARIDELLPQTQCTRCGHDGCAPYARAVARGDADIDRCPPGGDAVVASLAALLGRAPKPVDPACGTPGPLLVAVIDEAACIGCTLCIEACPVDAIVGAAKRMHAILPSLCSGCELCVAPCPVDCITMVGAQRDWTREDALDARARHDARRARLARNERIANRKPVAPSSEKDKRRAAIAAALIRARARRAAGKPRA
ncbi:MAG: RnfABCDGE type electron transport complex subunit B [Casimicrobiaceae bacterium]